MQLIVVYAIGLCLMAQESMAMSVVLDTNRTNMRGTSLALTTHKDASFALTKPPELDLSKSGVDRLQYGREGCRCIGIDNMKGYYATQLEYHHIQYVVEAGASCSAWEQGLHPQCQETPAPDWCNQRWCYVDPCSCDLEDPPKASVAGSMFRGQPAYYSYATCGFQDLFTGSNEHSCVNQKSSENCLHYEECAWDGKKCQEKNVAGSCSATKGVADYGEEDCSCVGLHGRDVGKAFMYINDNEMVQYDANVGSSCHAWEMDAHPDCKKDGEKPAWCSSKWCFVDPCKCKAKTPPRVVMDANSHMQFQGKVAFWSYDTCGNEDTWSSSHKGMYCVTQKTEEDCNKMKKCAWSGKECLGKALVDVCEMQEKTGELQYDNVFKGGASSLQPMLATVAAIMAALQ